MIALHLSVCVCVCMCLRRCFVLSFFPSEIKWYGTEQGPRRKVWFLILDSRVIGNHHLPTCTKHESKYLCRSSNDNNNHTSCRSLHSVLIECKGTWLTDGVKIMGECICIVFSYFQADDLWSSDFFSRGYCISLLMSQIKKRENTGPSFFSGSFYLPTFKALSHINVVFIFTQILSEFAWSTKCFSIKCWKTAGRIIGVFSDTVSTEWFVTYGEEIISLVPSFIFVCIFCHFFCHAPLSCSWCRRYWT